MQQVDVSHRVITATQMEAKTRYEHFGMSVLAYL